MIGGDGDHDVIVNEGKRDLAPHDHGMMGKHRLLSLFFQLLSACVACARPGKSAGHAGRQQLKKE